ncbi:MAG: bifunctional tRNA (5-methylaminomethyl-2-thiouridine)(34)-methyltransferase MnmD/FAD-dependent 5-carboxymethylaminomethyl-2-thiouridine(34) oxidoreductase MnmC [Betaproteobacteria bacterium]
MPTDIDWLEGAPYSRVYGDVYFSRASGLDEARHVFLGGNRLPERFAALAPRGAFTIGETGFGTGRSFLCAWQLFEQRAPAQARLHFVSTELHPLSPADLARTLDLWPELAAHARELCAVYDDLPPAFHRFVFAGGRVTLTLLVGDARATLPQLDAVVDAWFLDGFAPSRNPVLWSEPVFREVSRLSRCGATCATYSVAGAVRRGLEAVGFRLDRAPGFGTKREMLRGHCERPVGADRPAPWHRWPATVSLPARAVVLGGGLAGTSAAASLARRGFAVTLIERADRLAPEASGNAQGVLYIKPSAHGTALTALALSGLSFVLRLLPQLLPCDGVAWSRCGVLNLAHDAGEALRQAGVAALEWPAGFLRAVDRQEAGGIAGLAMPAGGLYYPRSGWVHPPALCEALARHPGIEVRLGVAVETVSRAADGCWQIRQGAGIVAEAEVLVVAGALPTTRFGPLAHLPLKGIRGQVTALPATAASSSLSTVLCGEGYVAPARAGIHWAGATFGVRDAAADFRPDDNASNLAMLASLAPSFAEAAGIAALEAASLPGRAGVRCVTPDYLPLAGPVVDADAFRQQFQALARDARLRFEDDAPWLSGLHVSAGHGSRGLITAPLCGEVIASLAAGEPAPLPVPVMQAIAPPRFLVRGLVRGGRPGVQSEPDAG